MFAGAVWTGISLSFICQRFFLRNVSLSIRDILTQSFVQTGMRHSNQNIENIEVRVINLLSCDIQPTK